MTRGRLPHWIPALIVGMLVSGLTVLLWQAFVRHQQQTIVDATRAAAVAVTNELTARLEARMQAVARLVELWEQWGPLTREQWEFHAR